jgi:hypothetical protein
VDIRNELQVGSKAASDTAPTLKSWSGFFYFGTSFKTEGRFAFGLQPDVRETDKGARPEHTNRNPVVQFQPDSLLTWTGGIYAP